MTNYNPPVWLRGFLITERVVLRRPQGDDHAALMGLLMNADVRCYLGGPMSEEDARANLSNLHEQVWGSFVMVLKVTNAVMGTCSLRRSETGLELSYAVLPEYWHQGLAAEGVGCALSWAARTVPAQAVSAWTQEANYASRALLERLGFRLTHRFTAKGADQVMMAAELAQFNHQP